MTDLRIGDVLAWFPGLEEQLGKIPGLLPRLKRVFPGWPWTALGGAPVALTVSLLAAAGLGKLYRELDGKINDVLAKLADIGSKAERSRAAELKWVVKLLLPDAVVFGNDVGDIATLPLNLVRVLAKKHQLEAAEVFADYDSIVVMGEEGEIASIPMTLWVCLEQVLEQCPFDLETL